MATGDDVNDSPEVAAHRIGSLRLSDRFDAALAEASRALKRWPDDTRIRLELAATLLDARQTDAAVDALRAILDRDPNHIEARFNLGLALLRTGKAMEAAEAFAAVAQLRPDFYDAHAKQGLALIQAGQREAGVRAFRAAANIRPDSAQAHSDLGAALAQAGCWPEALPHLRKAVALAPSAPQAARNLAMALFDAAEFDQALPILRHAIERDPANPQLHQRLGVLLGRQGDFEQAAACFGRAIELGAVEGSSWVNLSSALERAGFHDRALEIVERGLTLHPGYALLHTRRGDLRQASGNLEEAIADYRRAIELEDQLPAAHVGLATALLARGDFLEGLSEYEWRLRLPELRSPPRRFVAPRWGGEDPAGKTILLHSEQGFGDAIQFVRYAPLIAKKGAKVIVQCPEPLAELFAGLRGVSAVVASNDEPPPFDMHLPMMSAPHVMRTDVATIPADVPYLHADEGRRARWRDLVGRGEDAVRVGICRAGRAPDALASQRSIKAKSLAVLAKVPNVIWYELALPDPLRRDDPLPSELRVVDYTSLLSSFAETAGLLDALDLIITIDSAVAHLSGAMGKPTWLLLPQNPDWRWRQLLGDRSRWYPTIRVFQQQGAQGWPSVLELVAAELLCMAKDHGSTGGS
jgi:tetratricopeptide (TPR) repeat protein